MSIVEKYINYVKNDAMKKPEKSWDKIILGYKANKWITAIAPNRNISKGYQKLETMMMALVADSLAKKQLCVGKHIQSQRDNAMFRPQHPFHRMSFLLSGRISS